MSKSKEMLKIAGFEDTPEGRSAFYKKFPTQKHWEKRYGNGGNVMSYEAGGPTTPMVGPNMYAQGGYTRKDGGKITPDEFVKKYYGEKYQSDKDPKTGENLKGYDYWRNRILSEVDLPLNEDGDIMFGAVSEILRRMESANPEGKGFLQVPINQTVVKELMDEESNLYDTPENVNYNLVRNNVKLNSVKNPANPVRPFGWGYDEGSMNGGYKKGGRITPTPRRDIFDMMGLSQINAYMNGGDIQNIISTANRYDNWLNPTPAPMDKFDNGGYLGLQVRDRGLDLNRIKELSTDSSLRGDLFDVEFSNVGSRQGKLYGGIPLNRQGTLFGTGAVGLTEGMNRTTDTSYIPSPYGGGYRMTDWEKTLSPTAEIGLSYSPFKQFNRRGNADYKRGFSLADTTAGVGLSYDNAKIAPYIDLNTKLNYNFGSDLIGQRRLRNQPFSVYAGLESRKRFNMNEDLYPYNVSYHSGSVGQNYLARDPGPNERATGASVLNFYGGLEARTKNGLSFYGNVGTDPALRGKEGLEGKPMYTFGMKKTFADGGQVGDIQDIITTANRYDNWLNPPINKYALGDYIGPVGDILTGTADTALSALGGQDIIGDKQYSKSGFGTTMKDASHYTGSIAESLVPTGLSLLPGVGQILSPALNAFQTAVGGITPTDPQRLMSESGQKAAKIGMGLDLAGAVTSLGTGAAKAGATAAKLAKAAKIAKTTQKAANAIKTAKDIYDVASDPNATAADWIGAASGGLGIAGNFAGADTADTLKTISKFGNLGAQGIKTGQALSSGKLDAGQSMAALTGLAGTAANTFGSVASDNSKKIYDAVGGGLNTAALMANIYNANKEYLRDGGYFGGNMRKFANGGPTEINVEGNELMIDPSNPGGGGVPRIAANYQNIPPHPEDGSLDMGGNVMAQPGNFIIPKWAKTKYEKAAKTNDKLYADALMNNISRKKQQKEMEQATQQMYAEQEMINGTPSPLEQFVAQYGGFIPAYGMGGDVEMYANGADVENPDDERVRIAREYLKIDREFFREQRAKHKQMWLKDWEKDNPGQGRKKYNDYWYGDALYEGGIKNAYKKDIKESRQRLKEAKQDRRENRQEARQEARQDRREDREIKREAIEKAKREQQAKIAPVKTRLEESKEAIKNKWRGRKEAYDDQRRQQRDADELTPEWAYDKNWRREWRREWREEKRKNKDALAQERQKLREQRLKAKQDPTDKKLKDPNAPGAGMFEQSAFEKALPYVGPLVGLGYSLFEKPFTLNAKDYEVTDRVKPYEDTYVPDYDLYNTAKYQMRQAAGSSPAYLASLQGIYNRFAKGTAEERRKVKEANQARKMAADVENLKIQQENAKTRMTVADYNERQRSERTNAILQNLIGETGLTAMAMKARENKLMEGALMSRYPAFFGLEEWNPECPDGKKKDANGNCV
jgi:hypothetical protein